MTRALLASVAVLVSWGTIAFSLRLRRQPRRPLGSGLLTGLTGCALNTSSGGSLCRTDIEVSEIGVASVADPERYPTGLPGTLEIVDLQHHRAVD